MNFKKAIRTVVQPVIAGIAADGRTHAFKRNLQLQLTITTVDFVRRLQIERRRITMSV